MTAQRMDRMRRTLERRQPDLAVLMDQVHKPHNLGAILRTCDAVGVAAVHAVTRRGEPSPRRAASSGVGQWVEVQTHPDIPAAMAALREQGMTVYAAHLSDEAVDFRSVDYTCPSAVLLGAEKHGVGPEAAALADRHITIPMHGLGASLNVSVAAAVILYEAERQRVAAGLYGRPRLEEAVIRRKLFEWLHPKLAARFRAAGTPYPELDDEGCIVPRQGNVGRKLPAP